MTWIGSFGTVLWISFLAVPAIADSARGEATVSLVVRASEVSDLRSSGNNDEPAQKFGSTLSGEFGLRLRGYFQFVGIAYRNHNDTRQGIGGGFRVDTPGFFWLGGKDRKVGRRNWPINTSIAGFIIRSTTIKSDDTKNQTLDSRMAMAIDVFPFNNLIFLTAEAALLTSNGNGFSDFGGGIGMEF